MINSQYLILILPQEIYESPLRPFIGERGLEETGMTYDPIGVELHGFEVGQDISFRMLYPMLGDGDFHVFILRYVVRIISTHAQKRT